LNFLLLHRRLFLNWGLLLSRNIFRFFVFHWSTMDWRLLLLIVDLRLRHLCGGIALLNLRLPLFMMVFNLWGCIS
jgi:hypothetical protein